jgi:hypothetical protein
MKLAPLNTLQLTLMVLLCAAPLVGADWPSLGIPMQITVSVAAGVLSTLNFYVPSPVPSQVLGPQGVQTVHVLQALLGSAVSTLSAMAAFSPTLGAAAHVATEVGGVLMGVLGLFSPQALATPAQSFRMRRLAAQIRKRESSSPSPTQIP